MLHKAPAMPTNTACSAVLKLDEEGDADLLISGVDYGQGTYTVLRQIAAEKLRIPVDRVRITWECDTAFSPYDWSTVASRFAYMGGNAVIEAAEDCLRQLREIASLALSLPVEDIVCRDVYSVGGPVIGRGRTIARGLTHLDPDTGQGLPAQFWTYGAHAVELEVDTHTGEVTIVRIATALDAGKVLNPMLCRGQVIGGVIQGLGSALWEGFRFDAQGGLQNGSFVDYKIPTAKDLPGKMSPILLETPQPGGPFGARGVAEHPMISVPSAIGNALYDALGVDFFELPLTAERIRLAIDRSAAAKRSEHNSPARGTS